MQALTPNEYSNRCKPAQFTPGKQSSTGVQRPKENFLKLNVAPIRNSRQTGLHGSNDLYSVKGDQMFGMGSDMTADDLGS